MSVLNISILLGIIVALCFSSRANSMFPSMNQHSWTYELKFIESKSSNEDLISFECHVERVSRGVYSMSGVYKMNVDVLEGDDNEIEILVYRSKTGGDDFKLTPLEVPREHIFEFFNTFYKDMAMETLKNCSNLPAFKEKFKPPFEKKTYTLEKCQFSQDNYPQHMPDGLYKVVLAGYGTVEWTLTLLLQVEPKH